MSKKLHYISLFSSAGIGCYGFKQEGFNCVATCEYLQKRLNIQKYNSKCRFKSGYIQGDMRDPQVQERIFKELERSEVKDLDVIVATPPCQGMSVANNKKSNEIKKNSLVVDSIKIVKKIEPKFFIFENVRAFLKTLCSDTDGKERSIEEAIKTHLQEHYSIESKVINFKEYGANSSRTRTLVIGVRKDLTHIKVETLFPKKSHAKSLRELIAHLPSLQKMGEISEDDIYHAYRSFEGRMLPWIEHLSEGASAFDNQEEHRIPHRVIEGKRIYNKRKNSDKYSRWYWDRVAPCVHTRNDTLSSQNTIHPSDNRVFSIRELIYMMSIPRSFKFSRQSLKVLNSFSAEEKRNYLKKEELNIRHCIGEAVPTIIFQQIAKNIEENLITN